MEKEINTFGKGVNKDIDISLQPNDSLREAYGFRLLNYEGSSFVATNFKGTEYKDSLPQGYIPLNVVVADEIAFIFSHNPITGYGQIGCFPSPIYPVTMPDINNEATDLELEYKYKPLYNYSIPPSLNRVPFDTNLFYFDLEHNLQLEARFDYDRSYNIYFTDYKNPPRVINTGLAKQENGLYKLTKRTYNPQNFTDIINLSLNADAIAKIEYVEQKINEGNLKQGCYFYHIRYSNDKVNKTPFVASSFPVYVYQYRNRSIATGSESAGYGNNNTVFGKDYTKEENYSRFANVMQVTGLDTQFKYFHIFVEYIGGDEVEIREYYELQEPFEISSQTSFFIHKGIEAIYPFGEQELNLLYATIDKVKSIAQNDSRLLLANIISQVDNKVYEVLEDYTKNIEIRHSKKKINSSILPELHIPRNDNRGNYIAPMEINQGNAGYKDPYHVYYHLGYHYGEIYQFGVQYIFKDNSYSNVFLLKGNDDLICNSSFNSIYNTKGVYRFPKRNSNGYDEVTNSFTNNRHTEDIIAIFPTFHLPDWNNSGYEYIKDNVIGFRFVRIERKRDAYAQGVLLPTYKLPFLKWGDGTYKEAQTYVRNNFNYGGVEYQFKPNSNYWFDTTDGNIAIVRSKFYNDPANQLRSLPLPLGYIEGTLSNDDGEYRLDYDIVGAIVGEYLHDPMRYGFISSDVVLDEKRLSILNQNKITFEVVSGYKPYFSDHTGYIFYRDTSNIFVHAVVSLVFPKEFNTYQGDGLLLQGTAYYVFGAKNARNEKFSSVIDNFEGGGFKIRVHNTDNKDNWITMDYFAFNSYVGIRIGDGTCDDDYVTKLRKVFAITNADMPFNHPFITQFYINTRFANNTPNPPVANNIYDCHPLVFTDAVRASLFTFNRLGGDISTDYYVIQHDTSPYQATMPIVDLFLSETGRTQNIDTFYDNLTKSSFFFPVTHNLSKDEIASNGFVVRGVNGDNYQGCFYRKIFYRNYKKDLGSGLGERFRRGGLVALFKLDNNINPYSRLRELVYVGENERMSDGTEGNRRSYFPVYAYDKLNVDAIPFASGETFTASMKIPVNEAIWKYAKTYYTDEAKNCQIACNIQKTNRRVNNVFIEKPLYVQNYYPTRVYYSAKHITNSFIDNYRLIDIFSYQDYDISLGVATAIKVVNNQLYLIQENGVSLLSFNERQFVGEDSNVYINTNSILSPYQAILSRKYGSQHINSVLATDNTIYFVDVKRRAICRINNNAIEVLSDNRLSSFLNYILDTYDNTNEVMSDLTIRSYYNKKYREVLFIFTNLYRENSKGSYCIAYNENIDCFIFHPYIPELLFNIYNNFYAITDINNRHISYPADAITFNNGISSIYEHEVTNIRNNFYGQNYPLYFHYIVNKNFEIQKIFDNIIIVSNHILPVKLYYKVYDETGAILEDTIDYVNGIPIGVINNIVNRFKYIEGTVRGSIAYSNKGGNTLIKRRNRDKAIEIGIYYETNDFLNISRIITSFRYSFS